MKRTLGIFACVIALLLPVGMLASAARAQKEAPVRTVHGEVVDKDGNPLQNAVVQLRNLKTQVIRSYISDDQGEYRFAGLDPNLDYEIHAETQDMTSVVHKISSFDTRKEIDLTIRVDKKKSEK
jgi:protocatechuate 3,4-dioxygenase beta subunit